MRSLSLAAEAEPAAPQAYVVPRHTFQQVVAFFGFFFYDKQVIVFSCIHSNNLLFFMYRLLQTEINLALSLVRLNLGTLSSRLLLFICFFLSNSFKTIHRSFHFFNCRQLLTSPIFLHGTIYSIFAYYMRTVQSNFRNLII